MEDFLTGEFFSAEGLRRLEEEEAEWESLVRSPESQRFLEKMVKEVEEDIAAGRIYEFDPSDSDWEKRLEREKGGKGSGGKEVKGKTGGKAS